MGPDITREFWSAGFSKVNITGKIPGSHVHGHITLYCVKYTSFIVGICKYGILTTIIIEVCVQNKNEICISVNIMPTISCININGGFAIIRWYNHGAIKNRSVISLN